MTSFTSKLPQHFIATLLLACTCMVYAADDSGAWLTLPNSSVEPIAGSALDLSKINQSNKNTSITHINNDYFVNDQGKPIRFFAATLVFSPNTDGFPDHQAADRLASMIKRNGYNAVRIHFTEAMLMHDRHKDFDYDATQLDRFYYLVAALRKQEMYFFVDMLGSWNGAYGDVRGHRWTKGQHDVTLGSYLSEQDKKHWLDVVKTLWAHVNPYTHVSMLTDPALAGVMLVNEGDTDFLLRANTDDKLSEPFANWVIKKSQQNPQLKNKITPSLEAIKLPSVNEHSALNNEFQLFTTELQNGQLNWMRQQLSLLGYTGPVTSFNTQATYHNSVSRKSLSFVDQHQYADHTRNGQIERGTVISQSRLLDGKNRYLDRLAWARQYGQPFTVSEYGQPFWNKYRWEVAPFTAAYAAFQDWSMIAHFGNVFSLSRPAPGKWRQMMVPFEIGVDPTLQAGEKIAAFLFGRGDVSAGKARLSVKVPDAAAGYPADRFVSWQLAQMQYVLGVGLNVGEPSKNESAVKGLEISTDEDEIGTKAIYAKLLENKVIEDDGWTNPSLQRYQSSTKELKIDLKQNYMTVVTKGSVGVMGGAGSKVETPVVSIKVENGEGSFFIHDLGEADLSKSKRALLIMSTDSRNSNMTFLDKEETKLDQIGTFPAKIKDATITFEFKTDALNSRWKLYALDFTGKRTTELPLKPLVKGGVQAQIKLASLANKITPYFELTH